MHIMSEVNPEAVFAERPTSEYDVRIKGPIVAKGPVLLDAEVGQSLAGNMSHDPLSTEDLLTLTQEFKNANQQIRKTLLAMDNGQFLLDTNQFRELDDIESAFGEMRKSDEFGYGRHKNTHGLEFGQLTVQTGQDKNRQILLALKPFDTPKAAAHEHIATHYINSFADEDTPLPSFRPVGFYRDVNGQFCTLTEYDSKVQSFDNIFWDLEATPKDEQVKKALSRCALSLSILHDRGLSHGDAQVKNLATDNNGIRFIDLEAARVHSVDREQASSVMLEDISTFFSSLTSGGNGEQSDYINATLDALNANYIQTASPPHGEYSMIRPSSEQIARELEIIADNY